MENSVFPTLPIVNESKVNLANLKLAILNILATCGGVDSKVRSEKINFRMMDSTAQVSVECKTDLVPYELLCSIHPVLMFNRCVIDVFQAVESATGKDKLYAKIMVNATTTHDTVTEQFLDLVMRFISKDFDHKHCNYSEVCHTYCTQRRMNLYRFNRFAYGCVCAFDHVKDLWSFVDKYKHVPNNLACVLRAFQDLDCLVSLLLAASILGVHLVEPFLALTYGDILEVSRAYNCNAEALQQSNDH